MTRRLGVLCVASSASSWLARGSAALVASTVALAALVAPAAGAQAEPPKAVLELLSQDAFTPIGGVLHVAVGNPVDVTGLSVSVVAHQAISSRSGFDDTTADRSLGSVLGQVEVPLASVPLDLSGARQLTIGLQDPNAARDTNRLAVRRAGVYPLAFELRNPDDRTLSRFVSYLVVVPPANGGESIAKRLGVAWVWPMVAAPSTLPDGSPDPRVLGDLRSGGRLGRQAVALASTTARVTLVPGAETFEAWSALAREDANAVAGLDAIQGSSAHVQLLDAPYVPIDLPSLLAGNLGTAADAELVRGDDTLKRLFAGRVDPGIALGRPIDSASLGRLRARGADRFVVESSALAPATSRFTPTAPFALEAPPSLVPGGHVAAVASDAGLERLLTGDASPALRAQRFLAGLSVISLEQPNRDRAVVVVNPDDFDPPAALLDAGLSGLTTHPWLQTMTVADVFANVPGTTASEEMPDSRSLAPYNPPPPPVAATEFGRAQVLVDGFRSLVGSDNERVARTERALLLSVSSSFDTVRAHAHLDEITATIDAVVGKIQVPSPNTITLTARSGEIPLTFRNETGESVHVLLRVESAKLFFPDGATRTVTLPPRSMTVSVPVEARTSGSFPFRLVVSSADGRLPITDTRFRVRSTFVSTVGIVLTAGAGLSLVGWWGWDIRRRRRRRRFAAAEAL